MWYENGGTKTLRLEKQGIAFTEGLDLLVKSKQEKIKMNGTLAKIGGWAQFGLALFGQFAQAGTPHGWAGWLASIASLAAAVGIHAASNVGQVDPSHPTAQVVKQ
jgi:hypothetical protein